MRAAAQIVSYEIPSGLAILTVVILTGSLSIQDIIKDISLSLRKFTDEGVLSAIPDRARTMNALHGNEYATQVQKLLKAVTFTELFTFEKQQDSRGKAVWVRIRTAAYTRQTAVQVFQNELLDSPFNRSLRPVADAKPSAIPAHHVLCGTCAAHKHEGCTRGTCSCGCRLFGE